MSRGLAQLDALSFDAMNMIGYKLCSSDMGNRLRGISQRL